MNCGSVAEIVSTYGIQNFKYARESSKRWISGSFAEDLQKKHYFIFGAGDTHELANDLEILIAPHTHLSIHLDQVPGQSGKIMEWNSTIKKYSQTPMVKNSISLITQEAWQSLRVLQWGSFQISADGSS